MDTEIIYHRENLIAFNKPSGLFVHPSPLDSKVKTSLLKVAQNLINDRLYPVHRLDRATSGVVLFAKNTYTAAQIGHLFRERKVKKTYIALVRGWIHSQVILDYPLKHLETGRKQDAQSIINPMELIRIPKPVDRYPEARYSLISIEPVTGRRHQIRRHLKHLGHPIIGDTVYGKSTHNRFMETLQGLTRLYLHCSSMAVNLDGEERQVLAPVPSAFNSFDKFFI